MKKITVITALFLFVFITAKAQRTIITNPGFGDGINGWSTVSDKATFDIDGNSLITGLKSGHIKIVTKATDYFESGILWGFVTPKNASYNLKFKAKASKASNITIEVSEAQGPDYKLLGLSEVANLTTSTKQFEFNFSGNHSAEGRFALNFFTGALDLGTNVWIDDVILTETSTSSNLTNGDSWDNFNIEMPTQINGWETWLCCGAPGVASPNINFSVIDNANSISGKTMQIQSVGLVAGQEADLWRAQFAWWFTPIKGAQYTFNFKAKASTQATISYEIISQNGDPNAAVGDPNRANWIIGGRPWIQEVIPTTVKSYSFTTLPVPTWDHYKISFWFGGVPGGTMVWLDDVELIQTSALISNADGAPTEVRITKDSDSKDINIFADKQHLKINVLSDKIVGSKIIIYDVTGKVTKQSIINNTGLNSYLLEKTGFYMVQVIGKSNLLLKSGKIVIQD